MARINPARICIWASWAASLASFPPVLSVGPTELETEFGTEIRPLIQQFCLGCHSTEKHKGDMDLERFTRLSEVLKHPKPWQQVVEQLSLGEMPPKGKPAPSPAGREHMLTWVNQALDEAALAHAGDPGLVSLRRLNNAEFTYTVRDLTGVDSLDPAKEFPGDSAAGEGFMNTGSALVMSAALLSKYLDAGKEIASHAVLLPDGFRFSSKTSRRDWTEELLAEIRQFYRRFTEDKGSDKVNLQGIVFDTNEGGRLPLELYLRATLDWRGRTDQARAKDTASSESAEKAGSTEPPAASDLTNGLRQLAVERGLSPKYLELLWRVLQSDEPSLLLDLVRVRWRQAKVEDAPALAAVIGQWQKVLWKFSSVGHIGKAGGPKAWMEPVSPLTEKQDFRLKLPRPTNDNTVTLYFVASDAGDGNTGDFVVWHQPRLVVPGRPNLLLRDARQFIEEATAERDRIFLSVAQCLAVAEAAAASTNQWEPAELARQYGVNEAALQAWLDYLGIGSSGVPRLDYFTNQITSSGGYGFIQGWGTAGTPLLVANSSGEHVRIPGNMKPHGVAVHPSPKLNACVGWRSPVVAPVRVEARIAHAHPECGNGIEWFLELRRGNTRQRLAKGIAQGSKTVQVGPVQNLGIQPGDLISLLIGPRDGNHSCDLTDIELTIEETRDQGDKWSLTRDVSSDVLAANPHPDRFGNPATWHFYTEPVSGADSAPIIPAGSTLARWQAAETSPEKQRLAEALRALLASGPSDKEGPDAELYRQLASLSGPLFSRISRLRLGSASTPAGPAGASKTEMSKEWGLDPALFGRGSDGSAFDSTSLCVQAPSVIEVRLPADLMAGAELVTTGMLDPVTGAEGSVQLQVTTTRPGDTSGLVAGEVKVTAKGGMWTSDNRQISQSSPIIALSDSAARQRIEAGYDEFRRWFPAALCYQKIVPVDEVITLTLFHREDEPLCRLMLDHAQKERLDRLWDELRYISRDAITLVDAFEQIWQYATQDADPKVFEPLRQPIRDRAAALQKRLVETQPKHIDALLEFASRAYRRPLTQSEAEELRSLYHRLRQEELPHEEAFQLTLARVFIAAGFLYRLETAGAGVESQPVSDWELASRLSYFLWSSIPDAELRQAAADGRLHEPEVLAAQARRMLGDARIRRLATEFGCAWLHLYDFNELNEKSERHFPSFADLRGPMFEEVVRYFTDVFQSDDSILTLFDSDHTFLNETLARHYGIPNVEGADWRRVDGVKKFGRGGVLGLGATLAKQSGASRTSPILRGNWVAEVLLGDKLPRPPKDVPRLPEDEATETLTVRQLVEKHSTDSRCASCHRRIDGYGFALEGYDAIGRARTKDLAGRPIDTKAILFDNTTVEGADGLRAYLLTRKRDVVVSQFCRKLLGYSLGRGVLLSDKPLLAEMERQLREHDYRFSAAVETIVRSRQFREIRGQDMRDED
jgi:hypothetical protein